MKLSKITFDLDMEVVNGHTDVDITGVAYDSRKVEKGNAFIAIKGFKFDGHDFINEAIKKGAGVIIVQRDVALNSEITLIRVKDSRQALAKISSEFYNNPSNKFNLIGVTGTNGKTSTTYIIDSIFRVSGKKTGIIGTMGSKVNGRNIETKNTTPESLELQQLFDEMLKYNVENCIMEVSSHSLELNRVAYSNFDVGIFTNITVDHLDYHKTFENYYNAKKKLFYMTSKYNIINIDDEYGRRLIDELSKVNTPLLTYGIESKGDIYATDLQLKATGVSFKLHTPKGSADINMNIPGVFTVYNSLAAASCAFAYGISIEHIKEGLEQVKGVKGRFEVIPTNKDFTVIVDFAHTADALDKVLSVIEEFAEGRKIIVFGAGGDRDKSKRAPMGEVAGKHCDLCIVTSDNPRTEEPKKIIDDIIEGIKNVKGNYIAIVDRKEAIEYAIKNSRPKDIILLAGKGHETYTIIGEEVLTFDESKIVKEALKSI
ncbi:UDP-N-acetylmuramoyl-L-alanyl-D-glutamate--2,6-diaminopimelate ligase [Proteiniborus sp. MB09-C3]|uniref:UDP-N-acetylmuramoyl-L-alanyl-D-glutamate--2, 6-diaminopimelate ligase n=1 Tax=Proteiniborus sp. MB09-C3 TaxID=3050072 RepID=UPI0025525110|nr:UDP-N-acetylmuramoyl-L-alanyl-D-glutamate--2,6-diaminopimelate ligase [Proteiniborus sp. MB09-C3]WIV11245.1 UDP-N-acetylmuramoyl-L-alanyl-D-glutamate--2,6-diaminopimelate ligase [Proteiniborus sp. MB09-C3]